MAYPQPCCSGDASQLGDLGFAIPWGTIAGAVVDTATGLFSGGSKLKNDQYYPPALRGEAVVAGPYQVSVLAQKLKEYPEEQPRLRAALEAADGRWISEYRPQTVEALAAGAIDEAHGGKDFTPNDGPSQAVANVVKSILLKPFKSIGPATTTGGGGLIDLGGDVWTPPGGVIVVDPSGNPVTGPWSRTDGDPASLPIPTTSGGFPSTTGTQGAQVSADAGILGFLKDQLDQLKDNAVELAKLQAAQAAQAASGGIYNAIPADYQRSVNMGVGGAMLDKYLVPGLLVGGLALFMLTRGK